MIKLYTKRKRGFTFFPFIVLPQRVRDTIDELPYMEHEKVHLVHQGTCSLVVFLVLAPIAWPWALAGIVLGPAIWVSLYFGFWRWRSSVWACRFRFSEEAIAFAAEVQEHRRLGNQVDLRWFARTMAIEYWGMCTQEEALASLRIMGL